MEEAEGVRNSRLNNIFARSDPVAVSGPLTLMFFQLSDGDLDPMLLAARPAVVSVWV